MALTNIFEEPRRELTESAVGLVTVGIGAMLVTLLIIGEMHLTGDIHFADQGTGQFVLGVVVYLFGNLVVGLFLFLFVVVTHVLGEAVCNKLARRGIYLRPQQRYGRNAQQLSDMAVTHMLRSMGMLPKE